MRTRLVRTPVKPPTPTQCTSINKNVDPIILHQPKSQRLVHIICFIRLSDKTQRTGSFALSKNNKMPSQLFDKDCSGDQNVKIGKRVIHFFLYRHLINNEMLSLVHQAMKAVIIAEKKIKSVRRLWISPPPFHQQIQYVICTSIRHFTRVIVM